MAKPKHSTTTLALSALTAAAITTSVALTTGILAVKKLQEENTVLRAELDSYRHGFNADYKRVLANGNPNIENEENIKEKAIEYFLPSDWKPEAVLQEFQTKISSGTYIVEFTGPFCTPCKKMKPFITQSANSYLKHGIKTLEIFNNGDGKEAVKDKYKVTAYPTIIIFKDGKEIGRIVGGEPEKLNEHLKSILGK